MKIKCQRCNNPLEFYDQVVLDIFNGLTQQDCYTNSTTLIKDNEFGTITKWIKEMKSRAVSNFWASLPKLDSIILAI
ncbi:hypothetical protein [Cytobacillus praedii]|uniref:hypothetical protein n=1 Tax=Cytobacillus praedii TaxID=1742358 RepID=UPI002E1B31F0|nr:hypothetical protein [Cytobacillus praedii]